MALRAQKSFRGFRETGPWCIDFVISRSIRQSLDLMWLKTVSSNFQDVNFDGSLLPLDLCFDTMIVASIDERMVIMTHQNLRLGKCWKLL